MNKEVDIKLAKVVDHQTKKEIHIRMTKSVHGEFRKTLFDYGLSMQETIAHFANLVGEENIWAMRIVKDAYRCQRQAALKVTKKEAENLYDAISEVDPFTI